MKKHYKSFTLAEVLITLVIIGIIAVLTIQILFADTRKKDYSGRIKKFYSALNQAQMRAKADGNDWEEWAYNASGENDFSGETVKSFLDKYLLPYMIYTDVYKDASSTQGYYYVILNDGTFFKIAKFTCIDIQFDVNGFKGPNKEGVDKYWFLYCPLADTFSPVKAKITSYKNTSITSREKALDKCKESRGYCSGLLEYDSWEFKDDYPHHI